jgi:hypothetical protein
MLEQCSVMLCEASQVAEAVAWQSIVLRARMEDKNLKNNEPVRKRA